MWGCIESITVCGFYEAYTVYMWKVAVAMNGNTSLRGTRLEIQETMKGLFLLKIIVINGIDHEAYLSNQIHKQLCGVITHPCPNFNGDLAVLILM